MKNEKNITNYMHKEHANQVFFVIFPLFIVEVKKELTRAHAPVKQFNIKMN